MHIRLIFKSYVFKKNKIIKNKLEKRNKIHFNMKFIYIYTYIKILNPNTTKIFKTNNLILSNTI